MLEDHSNLLQGPKIITCILPAGMGKELVNILFHEWDLKNVNITRGRGASQRSRTIADEMDMLRVVVSPDRADALFDYLYDKAEIGSTPHRFMYQAPLDLTSLYVLPEEIEEEDR